MTLRDEETGLGWRDGPIKGVETQNHINSKGVRSQETEDSNPTRVSHEF